MATMSLRIPCYGYTGCSCSAAKLLEFGFDAAYLRVSHTCAETIWIDTFSCTATTGSCPLSSGTSVDIQGGGRTNILSFTGTSCGKDINIFAFGM